MASFAMKAIALHMNRKLGSCPFGDQEAGRRLPRPNPRSRRAEARNPPATAATTITNGTTAAVGGGSERMDASIPSALRPTAFRIAVPMCIGR